MLRFYMRSLALEFVVARVADHIAIERKSRRRGLQFHWNDCVQCDYARGIWYAPNTLTLHPFDYCALHTNAVRIAILTLEN